MRGAVKTLVCFLCFLFSTSVWGQAEPAIDIEPEIRRYQTIVQGNGSSLEARANLGILYFSAGRFEEAAGELSRFAAMATGFSRARLYLGMSLSQLGRFREAVPHLAKARAGERDTELVRLSGLHLQRSYVALGRNDASGSVLEELIGKFPNDPDVLFAAGQFYSQRAAVAWNRLATAAPGSHRFHQALGQVYESRGDDARADVEYRRALELFPSLSGVRLRLGRLALADAGRAAEAAQLFREELSVNPSNPDAHYELGEVLRKEGGRELALAHQEKAVALDPNFVEARLALGSLLAETDRREQALLQFRAACRIDPESEVARYRLARLLTVLNSAEAPKEMSTYKALRERNQARSQSLLGVLMGRGNTQQTVDSR